MAKRHGKDDEGMKKTEDGGKENEGSNEGRRRKEYAAEGESGRGEGKGERDCSGPAGISTLRGHFKGPVPAGLKRVCLGSRNLGQRSGERERARRRERKGESEKKRESSERSEREKRERGKRERQDGRVAGEN